MSTRPNVGGIAVTGEVRMERLVAPVIKLDQADQQLGELGLQWRRHVSDSARRHGCRPHDGAIKPSLDFRVGMPSH